MIYCDCSDLPWNLRKFLHGQLQNFNFTDNLKTVQPWSQSLWSHTDLPRLRRGRVGAQVRTAYLTPKWSLYVLLALDEKGILIQ